MQQLRNGSSSVASRKALSPDECKSVLERNSFGHLAFTRQSHVDAVPIRFGFVEGWLYFRANAAMRDDIGHNAWVLVSVVDMLDATHFASVVARGGCYETERTGSLAGDVAALRGIVRDRAPTAARRSQMTARTSTVFRLHVDELRGYTTLVPCPAGEVDPVKSSHEHQVVSRAESVGDDARADDDGMAEPRADRAVAEVLKEAS
jgi:nitroimidazol reductase NimA-like FMN-containing flavoprotein (pyridoxamine 5'-phosphate oxidase superfamily)